MVESCKIILLNCNILIYDISCCNSFWIIIATIVLSLAITQYPYIIKYLKKCLPQASCVPGALGGVHVLLCVHMLF